MFLLVYTRSITREIDCEDVLQELRLEVVDVSHVNGEVQVA